MLPAVGPRRHPLRRALAALLALALLLPSPALAQPYFAESDSLRPDTALELVLSDLDEEARTTNGAPLTLSTVDSSMLRVEGRYRRGILALGAMTESRRYHEVFQSGTSFDLRDDRSQSAGYAALVLRNLIAEQDGLFLVLSTAVRHEEFTYDAYQRTLDYDVGLQVGLIYRWSFLLAGYVRGDEVLDLRITDLITEQERYEFEYRAWLAGIVLGNPESVGLVLLYQRKDIPAVPGVSVNLDAGLEQLHRASLSLGALQIDYVQTRERESFSGSSSSLRESAEREFALSWRFTETIRAGISQLHVTDQQGFTITGTPATGRSDRTENQFRVQMRF